MESALFWNIFAVIIFDFRSQAKETCFEAAITVFKNSSSFLVFFFLHQFFFLVYILSSQILCLMRNLHIVVGFSLCFIILLAPGRIKTKSKTFFIGYFADKRILLHLSLNIKPDLVTKTIILELVFTCDKILKDYDFSSWKHNIILAKIRISFIFFV